MTDPFSLRNIPPDALQLAQALSTQTGLTLSAVFRLALVSGLLVEVTKVTPDPDGNLAGWEPRALARALRRHLGSAIDLLVEYGEHPYDRMLTREHDRHTPEQRQSLSNVQMRPREHVMQDDLNALGIGFGLSEALEEDG